MLFVSSCALYVLLGQAMHSLGFSLLRVKPAGQLVLTGRQLVRSVETILAELQTLQW
jgi:hypothetical protein